MNRKQLEDIFARGVLGLSIIVLVGLALNFMYRAPNAKKGLIKHIEQSLGVKHGR